MTLIPSLGTESLVVRLRKKKKRPRTEAKGLQFVRQKIVTIRYMAGQVAKTRNIA